jgi:hypothetical protein
MATELVGQGARRCDAGRWGRLGLPSV